MSLPSNLQQLIEQALAAMHRHSQHHLLPSQRLLIYQVLDTVVECSPHLNRVRGELGILSAQYVLPIWQRITPVWDSQAILGEASQQLSPEDLKALQDCYILGDHNILPQRWISLGQNVLQGIAEPEAASQEVRNLWDFPHGIRGEFLAQDELLATPYFVCKAPYGLLQRAYYVCEAAFSALQEIIGRNFLAEAKGLECFNDDNLITAHRDSASSAVIAYAGGADTTMPGDPDKRQEFWEWWLNEAIPMAYEWASQ